jgi:hypothetical protein
MTQQLGIDLEDGDFQLVCYDEENRRTISIVSKSGCLIQEAVLHLRRALVQE